MLKKSLILSLSLLLFANALCMESNNAKQLEKVKSEKTCWLMMMPDEVLLAIIKFCHENSIDEQELKKIVLKVGQINRRFRELMNDKDVLSIGYTALEDFKINFYNTINNLRYDSFKDSWFISRQNLLSKLRGFAKNKDKNVIKFHGEPDKNEMLFEAVRGCNLDFVILALGNGANINANDGYGAALICAIARDYKEIVALLISKGADMNVKDGPDRTLLSVAVIRGNKEMVELLISKGADINAKGKHGLTALHWATDRFTDGFRKEILELLIFKGANIDTKDDYGDTALMSAASKGHKELVEILENAQKNLANKDSSNNNSGKDEN